MSEPTIDSVLVKFLPRQEGGKAVATLDHCFGFSEKYLVTLDHAERLIVINALKEAKQ